MSGDSSSTSAKVGAVTFLDVLGWTGGWRRASDSMGSLQRLVKLLDDKAKELHRGRGRSPLLTQVINISDTIVLATSARQEDSDEAIELHGRICMEAIPASLQSGIPLRGATAFGQFDVSDDRRILVGPAIDEAAAWHELADWIGVFMAPSAMFSFSKPKSEVWVEADVPIKREISPRSGLKSPAVLWVKSEKDLAATKAHFLLMSPILPSVVEKFTNTLKFLEEFAARRSSGVPGSL